MKRWLTDVLSARRENFKLRREMSRKSRQLEEQHREIRRLQSIIIKSGMSCDRKK